MGRMDSKYHLLLLIHYDQWCFFLPLLSLSWNMTRGSPVPLPFFIIMAEGISRFIKVFIADKYLVGIPLHVMDPPISHNQFVDDTLMLSSPTVHEALRILSILQTFCIASGMDIIEKYPISYFLAPPSLSNFILPISKDLHVIPFRLNISTFPLLIKLYETTLGRGSFPP